MQDVKLSVQARSLWAKSGDETGWLPLYQHMIDAAMVAGRLWDDWLPVAVKGRLGDEERIRAYTVWIAGAHDLGKATRAFASKIASTDLGSSIVDGIERAGLPVTPTGSEATEKSFTHSVASQVILSQWLAARGVPRRKIRSLVSPAGAHHGIAPSGPTLVKAQDILGDYPEQWRGVHQELADWIASVTGIESYLTRLPLLDVQQIQLVTGIVVMADWIASNAEAFPMVVVGSQEERVDAGLAAVGLSTRWQPDVPAGLDTAGLYRRWFGWGPETTPRPVQQAAVDLVRQSPGGPALVIVEAPTGEGKTEAALALAVLLAKGNGSHGAIVAAPTMATANGLLQRCIDWARRATGGADVASMYLAHSKNMLNREFRTMKTSSVGMDEGTDHGEVEANQWLSGRKKGLLANFVVGTIDQVLMVALQMRHSMLRHLGLAGKVVILDEVHSYAAAYMGSYLQKTLQWLARYDVPVILLSATLPAEHKRQLVKAYAENITDQPWDLTAEGYPLITIVDAAGVREMAVEPRPTDMHAEVELIDDTLPVLAERLRSALMEGGCALVVCNTVRRAQEAFEYLRAHDVGPLELHHSAFIASERVVKEDHLRAALGPGSSRGHGRPDQFIVVATQVAEQSLDIDVDLLVTDLAPMDLIIQRAGRLYRHSRPASDRPRGVSQPRIMVRGVAAVAPEPQIDSGICAVYEPRILLATLDVLEREMTASGFRRPDDIAPLVQRVYDQRECPRTGWENAWQEAVDAEEANLASASVRAQTYQITDPFLAVNHDVLFTRLHDSTPTLTGEEAGHAQVRDAEPAIEVIPIVDHPYGYALVGAPDAVYTDDAELTYPVAARLAGGTLRLPAWLTRNEKDFEQVIDLLETHTPSSWHQHFLLKGQVALRLNEEGEIVLGRYRFTYSPELGLRGERDDQ